MERMIVWVFLLFCALIFGLGLNSVTIFWVGLLSLWVVSHWNNEGE